MRHVYIIHPYADDPTGNIEKVRKIAAQTIARGDLPIAPHLYLPQLFNEDTEREKALEACISLLSKCDAFELHGDRITEGMYEELDFVRREWTKQPIRWGLDGIHFNWHSYDRDEDLHTYGLCGRPEFQFDVLMFRTKKPIHE